MQVQAACQSLDKKYLRRRHKLYKAISFVSQKKVQDQQHEQETIIQHNNLTDIPAQNQHQIFCQFVQGLLTHNQNSSFDAQLFSDFVMRNIQDNKKVWFKYTQIFLQYLQSYVVIRSGHLIAYIFYRICRKNQSFFSKIWKYINKRLKQQFQSLGYRQTKDCLNRVTFWTDLYLYGFPITSQLFMKNIFPKFKENIVQLSIKYEYIYDWYDFFNRKTRYHIRTSTEQWLQSKIQNQKKEFKKLQQLKNAIQAKQIYQIDNTEQSQRYRQLFQEYEQKRYELDHLGYQLKEEPIELNVIKKQCEVYNKNYTLPPLLLQLYRFSHLKDTQIFKKKSNQMQKVLQDQIFLLQIRKCNNLEDAINLSGYFLQQLNNQSNRQNFVEYIIDYCHSESNLDLVVKILYQISQKQASLKFYLTKKGEIISNQIKMNKKYVNFLAQCTKFNLIKSDILLKYMERRLHQQSQNVIVIIKELELIIQSLGPSIYHQSLLTNIRINTILETLQNIVKSKQQMNIEILFGLKCLKNYLKLQKTKTNNFQEKDQLHSLNVKENFNFLQRKIQEILSFGSKMKKQHKKEQTVVHETSQDALDQDFQRIVKYFIDAISGQTYMNSYFYASLIKQLKDKKLMKIMLEKTVSIILQNIQNNIQTAVCWSRFLGQLYNYEIINRKRMNQIFTSFLQKVYTKDSLKNATQLLDFQKLLKCLIECLNVSKSYILQSEYNKKSGSSSSQQYVIIFLIQLKKTLLSYGMLKNYLLQDEFSDILQYFHPVLIQKLKNVQEITDFQQKMMNLVFTNSFSINNNSKSTFVNIYQCLTIYGEIDDTINFNNKIVNSKKCFITTQNQSKVVETKKKQNFRQKQQTDQGNQPNNSGKKMMFKQKISKKYMQKVKMQEQKDAVLVTDFQQNLDDQIYVRPKQQQQQNEEKQTSQNNTLIINLSLVERQSKQLQDELAQLETKARMASQQAVYQPMQQFSRGKKSQNLNTSKVSHHLAHHQKNGVRVLVKLADIKRKK